MKEHNSQQNVDSNKSSHAVIIRSKNVTWTTNCKIIFCFVYVSSEIQFVVEKREEIWKRGKKKGKDRNKRKDRRERVIKFTFSSQERIRGVSPILV